MHLRKCFILIRRLALRQLFSLIDDRRQPHLARKRSLEELENTSLQRDCSAAIVVVKPIDRSLLPPSTYESAATLK